MRATAKRLGWCVAFGLTLCVSTASASPLNWTTGAQASWLAAGQLGSSDQSENRRVAQQWLRQAREAMTNGNLDLAEYYLERAEKLNVQYDSVFARFKDTPEKVRKELTALRAQPGQPASSTPSTLSKLLHRPSKPAAKAPPADKYGAATPQQPAVQPAAAGSTPRDTTSAAQTTATADRSQRSKSLLLGARQAIAQGDTKRAELMVKQTRQLGLKYPLNVDSPDKVEALIRKAESFAQGPPPGAKPTQYARDFAQFLMDQSSGLLTYQQYTDAQRLAQQAKDLGAKFGQFDRTPDQLLVQIADAQRKAAGAHRNLADTAASGPQRLPTVGNPATDSKAEAMRLVAQARAALDRNDLLAARQLAEKAQGMAPDSAFREGDTRPWEILLEVNKAINRRGGAVMPAGHFESRQALADGADNNARYPVAQGVYNPATDASRTVPAQTMQPTPAQSNPPTVAAGPGERLYQDGLRALEQRDRDTALRSFKEAWKYEQDLDPETRQQLQDKLILLQANTNPTSSDSSESPLAAVDAKQQLLRQKLYREITSEQAEAQKLSVKDPKAALERLQKLRDRVGQSEADPGSKKQLLTLVDRNIDSLQKYIDTNRAEIELAEQNRDVLESVQLDGQRRQEISEKLAELVEQFNKLLDEQRYPEAEMIAKQARDLDPEAAVVQNLEWKSRFIRRIQEQKSIDSLKEEGFYGATTSALASSVPIDDRIPFQFGDPQDWEKLSNNRQTLLDQQRQHLTEAEIEIQKAMKNKVAVKFEARPLSEVMDVLSELSGVPIVLDPVGLAAEGVTSETPVTIRLNQQISLRSALNLILEPLRLSYVPKNEVLQVTSEQARDSNTYTKVYNVADLVIPIPNFTPGYNTGLAGAIRYAHQTLGYGGNMPSMGQIPLTVAANNNGGASNASVLAQMGAAGLAHSMSDQQSQPTGFGPGGMGGGAIADFDTLIELIQSTIAPDTWSDVGGAGAIEPFPTNLSLVISQTQDVHEQIAELLDQLRRLQDLQVTIEVRFITLNDNFFERIGIDFDFSVDDNVNPDMIRGSTRAGGIGDDSGPSVMFGLNQNGPTQTLDLEFTQGSFGSSIPQFGGFDATTAANFGFAILSDIEVFFLLEAAEGDQRSNVLQAPKVTLFNGQLASVNDTSQQPFVTSLIPVVGDFAAVQQPVVTVLSEGTQLSVQAVVSPDRRFVRLTLVPFFSRIGPVSTFTFEGDTSSNSGTIVTDPDGKEVGRNNSTNTSRGSTVQLPTFISTSVSTTVSVPDGGTVLLGGIKRLSEGRNERGVPMLSKIPYINRLFKNVGIGRETESLMMMVTPRIIIQEEEELNQTGYSASGNTP